MGKAGGLLGDRGSRGLLDRRTRWGLEKGNIDLNDRPQVQNPDGSVSTVRSAGFNIDDKEVLLPTVADPFENTFGTGASKRAGIVSDKKARDIYRKTGKHLGKFRTPQQADLYAETLHKMQERQYGRNN
jgi:hypothetical protein